MVTFLRSTISHPESPKESSSRLCRFRLSAMQLPDIAIAVRPSSTALITKPRFPGMLLNENRIFLKTLQSLWKFLSNGFDPTNSLPNVLSLRRGIAVQVVLRRPCFLRCRGRSHFDLVRHRSITLETPHLEVTTSNGATSRDQVPRQRQACRLTIAEGRLNAHPHR